MNAAVQVSFNRDHSRAAFRLFHAKGNIVTLEMIRALSQALPPVAENPHLKLVTFEGVGLDFSFGASIPEHAPGEIGRVLPEAHALIYELLDLPVLTAAIVRGRCLGGGFELALACDVIFAETSATFGLPEVALGVFPPAASALLPLRVGAARATSAIVTGRASTAAHWLDAGLLEAVVPDGTIEGAVEQWFETHLRQTSATALRFATAAARLSLRRQVRAVLPELEQLYLSDLMATHDAAEGITAFLEKRAPRWTDG
ncbi:MAG: enoyl-CoA hydratase-related protein [Vicinamibacterales bacterium]